MKEYVYKHTTALKGMRQTTSLCTNFMQYMTIKKVYTFPMYTLLASSLFGIFWLAFLFVLCFLGVHVLRLARMGQAYRKQQMEKPPPPPPIEKKEKKEQVEPVYYIVERKRRKKPSFSEPKRIQFPQNTQKRP